MKIRWLRRAEISLGDIAAYIAQDNPKAADKTIEKIRNSTKILSMQPYIGKSGRIPGTRELIIPPNYILPYRIKNNEIHILQVFHTARKWPKEF